MVFQLSHHVILAFLWLALLSQCYAVRLRTQVQHRSNPKSRELQGSLLQKWNLINPEVDYTKYQFNLEYTTSDYVRDEWITYTLYDSDLCKEGGTDITISSNSGPGGQNYLTTSGLIAKSTTPHNPGTDSGEGLRKFLVSLNIETSQIVNSAIYSEPNRADGQVSAEITFCARISLWNTADRDSPEALEINFQESVMTIFVDLTDGFNIDDIGTAPRRVSNQTVNIGCEVFAYHCDEDNNALAEVGKLRYQGEEVKVCVNVTQESQDSGLFIDRLYNFTWVRDDFNDGIIDVTQTAIVPDALPAPNGLTDIVCVPGSITCTFTTMLKADFFRFQGRVNGTGLAICRLGGTPGPEYFEGLFPEIDFGSPSAPELIDRDQSENVVYDGAPNGDEVGVTAISVDLIWNKTPTSYYLLDDGGGCFEIHPVTGIVTIKDRTKIPFAEQDISIVVGANAGYGVVYNQFFWISLIDVVDVDSRDSVLYEGFTSIGDEVYIIPRAADLTKGPFSYELTDNGSGCFEIDPSTGVVTVKDVSKINFSWGAKQITARITPTVGNTMTKTFRIKLARITDKNGRWNNVREDVENGGNTQITIGVNEHMVAPISYYLSDDGGGCFEINSSTGVVTVKDKTAIDYDANNDIWVTAVAVDGTGNRASDRFNIRLVRLQDDDSRRNEIPENIQNGDPVGMVVEPINQSLGPFTFSLGNDSDGRFSIDPETGEVFVADRSLFDFESERRYSFTVEVETSVCSTVCPPATIIGFYSIKCIRVVDRNVATDNEILQDVQNGEEVGIKVGISGSGASYTYSLLEDANGAFEIDNSNGIVRVLDNSAIPWDTSFTLEILVGVSRGSDTRPTQRFTIKLTRLIDIDDEANEVYENVSNGASVGVTVRPVIEPSGITYTYSFDDSADGRFAIDSVTGIISVAEITLFDFEVEESWEVTVRVVSSDGAIMIETFTMNAVRVIDFDPSINKVREWTPSGEAVGLTIRPAISIPGVSYTYSLSDSASGAFQIDGSSGIVTIDNYSKINFAGYGTVSITAVVTRSFGSSLSRTFEIQLEEGLPTAMPSIAPSASPAPSMPPSLSPSETPPCFTDTECPTNMVCVQKICIDAGTRWTLTWAGDDDLDLHVITPSGNEVYWNSQMDDNSQMYLTHDDRPLNEYGEWVENIAFPMGVEPEVGIYTFFVMNHDQEYDADPFEVKMFFDNEEVLAYTGTVVGDFSNGDLHYWEYAGNGRWPVEQCEDSPNGWYYNVPDLSEGLYYRTRNCAFFALDDNCADYGDMAFKFGRTANQACCACGGGTTGVAGISPPVDIPTLAPSIVPHDCPDGRRLQEGETCDTKITVHCGQKSIPTLEKLPGTTFAWPMDGVEVVSRQDTTVTFQIRQSFKTDGLLYKMHIMYPTDFGEVCTTATNVPPGSLSDPVTATCTAGVCSPVRVYVSVDDENSLGDSTVFQSELCEPEPDPAVQGSAGFLVYMACASQCTSTLSVETTRRLDEEQQLQQDQQVEVVPRPQDFGHDHSLVMMEGGGYTHPTHRRRRRHRDLQEEVNSSGGPFDLGFSTGGDFIVYDEPSSSKDRLGGVALALGLVAAACLFLAAIIAWRTQPKKHSQDDEISK